MNIKICDACKSGDKEIISILLPDHVDNDESIDDSDRNTQYEYPICETFDLCAECFKLHVYDRIYQKIVDNKSAAERVEYFKLIIRNLKCIRSIKSAVKPKG